VSFDTARKGRIENIGVYAAPTEIGDVMRAYEMGVVLDSRAADFKLGDIVLGPSA